MEGHTGYSAHYALTPMGGPEPRTPGDAGKWVPMTPMVPMAYAIQERISETFLCDAKRDHGRRTPSGIGTIGVIGLLPAKRRRIWVRPPPSGLALAGELAGRTVAPRRSAEDRRTRRSDRRCARGNSGQPHLTLRASQESERRAAVLDRAATLQARGEGPDR